MTAVITHESDAIKAQSYHNCLYPSESSWKRAEKQVESWLHIHGNDAMIGKRFLVGYEIVQHTKDIYVEYILLRLKDSWERHIAVYWADNDHHPFPCDINMYDRIDSFVFNGLWDEIVGESIVET